MNQIKPMDNEDGFIVIVALIILVLATMIGIAATMTASTELQVSGSDMRNAENFYKAEAAAMAGASALEETLDTLLKTRKYKEEGDSGEEVTLTTDLTTLPQNIEDETNWAEGSGRISADAPGAISDQAAGYNARFLPVEMSRPSGQSAGMTGEDRMHVFAVYGRSVLQPANTGKKLAEVIIEIGYKKRF